MRRDRFGRIRDLSLRDLLFLVIVVGILGLIVELVLLEHTETWQQWIPLAVLGAGIASCVLARMRPVRSYLRVFQSMMILFLVSGLLGLYFHYAGNVEFALERTPELSGFALMWESLRGATPTLAPGALAQLGLLGLVYAYRHPAVSNPNDIRESATQEVAALLHTTARESQNGELR